MTTVNAHVPLVSRVAGAPISWGVCEVPGWGHQLDVDTVLGDMAGLGFTHTETGPVGFLPTEPAELAETLGAYGLTALSGFVPLVMHEADCRHETLERADATMAAIAAGGGQFYVSCAVSDIDDWQRPQLTAAEWQHLYDVLDDLQRMSATHGLTQAFHPHVGATVETDAEVRAVLANSSATITLDTAHLTLGGADPVAICDEFAERVALLHLKDVNLAVQARFQRGDVSFMEAVQQRLFPPLGDGGVDIARVVELAEHAQPGRPYVLEQDAALVDGNQEALGQLRRDIQASLDYLGTLDMTA